MKKYIATANIVSMAFFILVVVFTGAMSPELEGACYQLLGLAWITLLIWSTILLLRKK